MVFDCDGTIVDTEPLSDAAWAVVLDRYGYEVTAEDQAAIVGRPFHRAHAYWLERAPVPQDPERLRDEKREAVQRLFDGTFTFFDDALKVMRALHRRGVPVAVSSSSSHDYVEAVLEQAGVREAVCLVVGADDVSRHKPDPEPFLVAARGLGMAAERLSAVEDSRVGVAAARGAGMWVVGVQRPHVPAGHLDEANRVVEALRVEHLVPADAGE